MHSKTSSPAGNQPSMKKFRRPKKYKAPPGQASDQDLIAAYLANGGAVKVCQPGKAEGVMRSTDMGLTTSY